MSGINYILIWALYLAAAVIFYGLFWRYTRFRQAWLSYAVRAVMAAVIFTPWYANTQDEVLAPALMVVMMDVITLGTGSAVRAFVPLFLSLCISLVVVGILLLLRKSSKA